MLRGLTRKTSGMSQMVCKFGILLIYLQSLHIKIQSRQDTHSFNHYNKLISNALKVSTCTFKIPFIDYLIAFNFINNTRKQTQLLQVVNIISQNTTGKIRSIQRAHSRKEKQPTSLTKLETRS